MTAETLKYELFSLLLKNKRLIVFLLGHSIVSIIFTYILAFHNVPIVYDEASYRRLVARGLLDGFVQFPVFPDCRTPNPVGTIFVPAHALISLVDGLLGWNGVRTIPIVFLLLAVSATAFLTYKTSPARWLLSLMTLSGGFIGTAGSGLVLSRFEFIAIFQISLVLFTIFLLQMNISIFVRFILSLCNLAAMYVSLFVHAQGLIIAPFSLFVCICLLRFHKLAMLTVVAAGIVAVGASISHHRFSCPDSPELERIMEKTHGVVFSNHLDGHSFISKAAQRVSRYVQQFPFFSENYFSIPLPPVDNSVALVSSWPIMFAAIVNMMLLFILLCLVTPRILWQYASALYIRQWPILGNANFDFRAVWIAAALALLLYSTYDLGGTFYRAHFRNLLTAILLAIAVAATPALVGMRWVRYWCGLNLATCVTSTVIAWTLISPKLADGYESYYVSNVRNWTSYDEAVRAVADRCGIGPQDERIISDMGTYQAVSKHRFPVDFNFVWYREYLEGKSVSRSEKEWREYYRQYSNSGFVVMCKSLSSAPMSVDVRQDGICCARF